MRYLQRKRPENVYIGAYVAATFGVGVICSLFSFISVFGDALLFLLSVLITALVPSWIAGVVAERILGRRHARILRTVIAWPMIGFGLILLPNVESEGAGMLVWLGLGVVMAIVAYGATEFSASRRKGALDRANASQRGDISAS